MRTKKQGFIGDLLMHLGMIFLSFICLYPFVLSFMVSISTEDLKCCRTDLR